MHIKYRHLQYLILLNSPNRGISYTRSITSSMKTFQKSRTFLSFGRNLILEFFDSGQETEISRNRVLGIYRRAHPLGYVYIWTTIPRFAFRSDAPHYSSAFQFTAPLISAHIGRSFPRSCRSLLVDTACKRCSPIEREISPIRFKTLSRFRHHELMSRV